MKRSLPAPLLYLLENWLLNCWSCVKWDSLYSGLFRTWLWCQIRFSIVAVALCMYKHIDDLAKSCSWSRGVYIIL